MKALSEPTALAAIADAVHSSSAPQLFLEAWKRGVTLIGPGFFGIGPPADPQLATSKWDLCPNLQLIGRGLQVLERDEQILLAAMVSLYDAESGVHLLQRTGVAGLADFGKLHLPHRAVIAALLLNYCGWDSP